MNHDPSSDATRPTPAPPEGGDTAPETHARSTAASAHDADSPDASFEAGDGAEPDPGEPNRDDDTDEGDADDSDADDDVGDEDEDDDEDIEDDDGDEDAVDRSADVLRAAFGGGGDQRCGLVAIVGRPNVGKSTLLNTLIGQKVSITSRKAQTTRHRITGICTEGDTQFVFVDTPGFQTRHTTRGTAALNRNLNKTVQSVLGDVDVVLFVVEAGRFGLDDAKVLALIPPGKPVLLVANKLDLVHRRGELMPWLKQMQERHPFTEFVPLQATKDDDAKRLLAIVRPMLPAQPWFYDGDALTDRSDKFLAAELIREKLFRLTGDELPYTSTVQIDRYVEEGRLRRIAATIIVEREAHKGMVIGDKGERLKRIGTEARVELERLGDCKVFLELWVKVRSGWADDEKRLKSYGYE
jgi:GTP-binding protein Era